MKYARSRITIFTRGKELEYRVGRVRDRGLPAIRIVLRLIIDDGDLRLNNSSIAALLQLIDGLTISEVFCEICSSCLMLEPSQSWIKRISGCPILLMSFTEECFSHGSAVATRSSVSELSLGVLSRDVICNPLRIPRIRCLESSAG